MSSDDKSSVGESFVQRPRIIKVAAYLMVLCGLLFYALAALWPSAPLIVSALQPTRGRADSATSVSFSGTGFAAGATVKFGDQPGTVSSVTSTSMAVLAPIPTNHAAGKVRIRIANPGGQEVVIPDGFTYVNPIVIKTIKPATGTKGDVVLLTGSGFSSVCMIKLGGIAVVPENVQVLPSGEDVRITIPDRSPVPTGPVDVEVSDALGGKALVTAGFTFKNAAEVDAASKALEKKVDSTYTLTDVWSSDYRSADATTLYPVKYFWTEFFVTENVRLLLIIMIVGALGSLIHVFHSFYWYVGNRQLRNSWLLMYLLLPFNGAGLALLFYLIIRGGISSQAPMTQSSVDGYAAVAALVGLFSREAQAKLKKVAESFFSTATKGDDQATTSAFSITAVKPDSGPPSGGTTVTITGTGFATGIEVTLGGAVAGSVNVVSSTQLTAKTPMHPVGVVDVEASSSGGKKSLPKAFTYKEESAVADAVLVPKVDPAAADVSAGGKAKDGAAVADAVPVTKVDPTAADAPAGGTPTDGVENPVPVK
jgi:hypothetical protein